MVSFKVNLSDYFYFGRVIKMTEVMLTSGQGFEGYEIVEYLGFVNVQSVSVTDDSNVVSTITLEVRISSLSIFFAMT